MYSEKVMDHFSHPRNVGVIEDANAVGQVGNLKCGDIMKIYMKIENGIIEDIKFQTFGCGAAVATSSMATERVKGKPIEEALLAEEAIKSAIADYYRRQGIDPTPYIGCTGDCAACHHDHDHAEHEEAEEAHEDK